MLLLSLLYGTVFFPLPKSMDDEHYDRMQSRCEIKHDLMTMILYESLLPIDAIVFEIGISKLSTKQTNRIVDAVLTAKKHILANPRAIAKLFDMSNIQNKDRSISRILGFRHMMMQRDQSSILRRLIREHLLRIHECIREQVGVLHRNRQIFDPKRDAEFRKMILRLREAILENLDIGDMISKEKDEFYRTFRAVKNVRKGKISLSLGGSILNPKDMLELVSKIDAKDKTKAVREWVDIILEPIEVLQMNGMKSFVEQKFIVLDFLRECLERKTGMYDSAFEARSQIMKAAKLDDAQIQNVLLKQEHNSRSLLRLVENMREEPWIVRYNRQIKDDYVRYLLTLQKEDKDRIMAHFKE